MIAAIELAHFKSVGSTQRVLIKPITLLFGPNSSGKSTIFDAIVRLHATMLGRRGLQVQFAGEQVDLPQWDECRHTKAPDREPSVIRLDMQLQQCEFESSQGSPQVAAQLKELLDDCGDRAGLGVRWGGESWPFSNVVMEIRLDGRTAIVAPVPAERDEDGLIPLVIDANHPALKQHVAWCRPRGANGRSGGGWDNQGSSLWAARSSLSRAFADTAVLVDVALDVTSQRVHALGEAGYQESTWESAVDGLSAKHDNARKLRAHVSKLTTARQRSSTAGSFWASLVLALPTQLAALLGGADAAYIGPHRRMGDVRIESEDGLLAVRDALTGRSAASVFARLVKGVPNRLRVGRHSLLLSSWKEPDSSLCEFVSAWCSDPSRLDLGAEIVTDLSFRVPVNDAVRKALRDTTLVSNAELVNTFSGLGRAAYDVRLRTRDGILRRPSEVGEGIGCVLPVVVAALGVCGPVYVEQPEIHLHPRVESRLADLFVYGIKLAGLEHLARFDLFELSPLTLAPCRIVETHSEHLILRLLRRLRESAAGKFPPEIAKWLDELGALSTNSDEPGSHRYTWIRPEDVAVVCAQATPDGTVYRCLRVSNDGRFLDPWPDGFFTERREELR